MKFYQINFEDFKRVFTFASKYYLEPTKNTTGRTTSEPRGLGAVIDAFTLGKLTEIGVEKILNIFNPKKNYVLDFDIHQNSVVKNDPDIIYIVEKNQKRPPELFIEIKNTGAKDRWIGLTEDQFQTIKRASKNKKIYFIYASIDSQFIKENPKTADLAGMFLKKIENTKISEIFQDFADLNALCKIEFIISSDDFDKFGSYFEKGMKMFETKIFKIKKDNALFLKNSKNLVKNCKKISENFELNKKILVNGKNSTDIEKKEISEFEITGDFELYQKKSLKFIYCLSDVKIRNDIFGEFNLEKNKVYEFFLESLGRDPYLKRNNIFISKARIYQLISEKKIEKPEIIIQEIANQI